jgi:hypothetical protein
MEATLHKRLIEKERSRRDAENNIKHLANRLRILEMEEQKVKSKLT